MRLQSHLPDLPIHKKLAEFYKSISLNVSDKLANTVNYTTDILMYSATHQSFWSFLHYLPERRLPPNTEHLGHQHVAGSTNPNYKISILAFGVINERKGIVDLLSLATLYPDVLFITAGKHSADVLAQLSSNLTSNIMIIDKFLSDAELRDHIINCDAIWCVQKGHNLGSSAVANAISFHKVLIYSEGFYIKKIASLYSKSLHLNNLFVHGLQQLYELKTLRGAIVPPYTRSPLFSSDWSDSFPIFR
jgi:hypothetical protein